jgi:hypothetical protein
MRVEAAEDAAVVFGAAEAPRTGSPLFGADADRMRDAAEQLQGQLGDEEFIRRLAVGRTMTDDDTIRFTLDAPTRASRRLAAV